MPRSPHPIIAQALLLLALACLAALLAQGQQSSSSAQGKNADPFASGGKPVVLIFLRTNCPISNRYAPTVQALAEKYMGKVNFWLIYPDPADSIEVITKNLHDYRYNLSWLQDRNLALAGKSKATITPEAAVFDTQGELQYHGRIDDLYAGLGRARSAPTSHELDDVLQEITSGKSVTVHTAKAVGCYIADLQ